MIAKLPKLRSLDLSDTNVSSTGVAYLKGHAALRELNLKGTRVGNAGMEAISGNENLTSLNVWATRVDDSGMVYIGKLRHLRSLSVGSQDFQQRPCGHRGARRTGGPLGNGEHGRRRPWPPAEHDEAAAP